MYCGATPPLWLEAPVWDSCISAAVKSRTGSQLSRHRVRCVANQRITTETRGLIKCRWDKFPLFGDRMFTCRRGQLVANEGIVCSRGNCLERTYSSGQVVSLICTFPQTEVSVCRSWRYLFLSILAAHCLQRHRILLSLLPPCTIPETTLLHGPSFRPAQPAW